MSSWSVRRIAAATVLIFCVASCSPTGTASGFCRRFGDLIDDAANGRVTEAEFRSRLDPSRLGEPAGLIGDAYRRLRLAINRGDQAAATSETFLLLDLCLDVDR